MVFSAETYYNAAWDIHRRNNKNDKNFWKQRWEFPALYQALMRCRMKDKISCKEYIEAQLKTFPQTPLESGFQNRLPVEYVEGDGHGDHWDCVTQGKLDDPEALFGTTPRYLVLNNTASSLPNWSITLIV